MRRHAMLSGALLVACVGRELPDGDDGVLDEVGSESSDSGGDDDLPHCEPFACVEACARSSDQCGEPMVGSCSDMDVCICEPVANDCQPCLPENCSEYEVCWTSHSFGGECGPKCSYEFEVDWTPAIGCAIELPRDLPTDPFIGSGWYVEIAGMQLPRGDTCVDPRAAWVLDDRQSLLSLCTTGCDAFLTAGTLTTGWAASCE